jgi:hypothetical protein
MWTVWQLRAQSNNLENKQKNKAFFSLSIVQKKIDQKIATQAMMMKGRKEREEKGGSVCEKSQMARTEERGKSNCNSELQRFAPRVHGSTKQK